MRTAKGGIAFSEPAVRIRWGENGYEDLRPRRRTAYGVQVNSAGRRSS